MRKGKIEYWISTEEVKNPWHDKRCKYDIQQYAKFDIGTKIVSFTNKETYRDYEIDVTKYYLFNGIQIQNFLHDKNGDLVKAWNVCDAFGLVPYSPTDEEKLDQEICLHDATHSVLLRRLLKKGIVSYESILNEYEEYIKEEY